MTPRRYAMIGEASGEALSYGGLILTHDDPAEMQWLFAGIRGRVVELGSQFAEADCMSIKRHPDLIHIKWPLRREDFV